MEFIRLPFGLSNSSDSDTNLTKEPEHVFLFDTMCSKVMDLLVNLCGKDMTDLANRGISEETRINEVKKAFKSAKLVMAFLEIKVRIGVENDSKFER